MLRTTPKTKFCHFYPGKNWWLEVDISFKMFLNFRGLSFILRIVYHYAWFTIGFSNFTHQVVILPTVWYGLIMKYFCKFSHTFCLPVVFHTTWGWNCATLPFSTQVTWWHGAVRPLVETAVTMACHGDVVALYGVVHLGIVTRTSNTEV